MSVPTAGHVVVATGTGYTVTGVDPSTLGVGVPNVNANSFYGNNTGSTAPGMSLTVAQAIALLALPGSPGAIIAQSGIPMMLPCSGNFANNGVFVLGNTPASSATASFSALSGSGVTMTMSAASLAGTSADNGKVLTINDSGTYKYATITAFSSTTVATVTLTGTLSGTGPFANSVIWLTGGNVQFPTTYSDIYVYFPANAISAGSSAGWYYCQMQSTTKGIAYNNVYTSGALTIPGSPTAFATTGPGNYTGATSANTIAATVTANSMGVNGSVEGTYMVTMSCIASNRSAKAKLGTTQMGSIFSNSANQQVATCMCSIKNRGVATKQVHMEQVGGSSAYDSLTTFSLASGTAYSGINTTVDQDVTVALSITSPTTDYMILESHSFKLYAH